VALGRGAWVAGEARGWLLWRCQEFGMVFT
jgi:hypothetical protein